MKYKILDSTAILRYDVIPNMSIPCDPANSDYQDYLRWVAEGNEPEPADPKPDPSEQGPSLQERVEAAETLINLILSEGEV